MTSDTSSLLNPLILSWNVRNDSMNPPIDSAQIPSITGSSLGEYPIDGWIRYFLEIPKDGEKKDITGRSNIAGATNRKGVTWNQRRTINLPIYSNIDDYSLNKLEFLIEHWDEIGIPDDIPCLAIAIKCSGFYSEYREAQYVTVLTVWNDGVARITSLDWFEGPLEDCITPEWYIKDSSLMNINDAIKKTCDAYKNTSWDSPSFTIYVIPKCLGSCLKGKCSRTTYNQWNHEWKYTDFTDFFTDVELVLHNIQQLFLKVRQEDEINE